MAEKNKVDMGIQKANAQEAIGKEAANQEDIEQLRARLEAAQAELTKLKSGKGAKETTRANDPRRRVKIKLYRDNNKNRDPLLVSVNDYTALIKRGVTVEVPYYVAKHIEEMAEQDAATVAMIEDLTQQFTPKSGVLS